MASVDFIAKNVSVLDAIQWVSSSVREMKKGTVKKYFRKAGIVPENSSEDINDKDDDDGNIPLAELVAFMRVAQRSSVGQEMSVSEYLGIDSDIPGHEEIDGLWEDDIVNSVKNKPEENDITVTEDYTKDSESPLQLVNSYHDALSC